MNALLSLISLSLIVFMIVPMWNRYRTDKYRQELFGIRDELFLDAAKGRISFSSNAYIVTRTVLNGLIRFEHKASFSRILLIMVLYPQGTSGRTGSAVAAAFEASAEQDRVGCGSYIVSAHKTVAKHLARSPYLLVISVPFVIAFWIARAGSLSERSVTKLKRQFSALDNAAYAEGKALAPQAAHCI